MISERKNDGIERPADQWFKRYNAKQPERGGAQKSESLKPKGWLEQTREAWADHANRALERAGHDARIDHRTHLRRRASSACRASILAPTWWRWRAGASAPSWP
ncbi:MobA/MobL family protein, partial [Klebsiella pneumoniae]|uniref:MobA/MobL family protein n=1 Tax=Klebsiella pneumoniae TaxID=573 RepID=UPI00222879C5